MSCVLKIIYLNPCVKCGKLVEVGKENVKGYKGQFNLVELPNRASSASFFCTDYYNEKEYRHRYKPEEKHVCVEGEDPDSIDYDYETESESGDDEDEDGEDGEAGADLKSGDDGEAGEAGEEVDKEGK